MSHVKLDSILGFSPIEPVLSDFGLSQTQPTRTATFDEHLQRAKSRPEEAPGRDSGGRSSVVEPAERTADAPPAADTQQSARRDRQQSNPDDDAPEPTSQETPAAGDQRAAEEVQEDDGAEEQLKSGEGADAGAEAVSVDAVVGAGEAQQQTGHDERPKPSGDLTRQNEEHQQQVEGAIKDHLKEGAASESQASADEAAGRGNLQVDAAGKQNPRVDSPEEGRTAPMLQEVAGEHTDPAAECPAGTAGPLQRLQGKAANTQADGQAELGAQPVPSVRDRSDRADSSTSRPDADPAERSTPTPMPVQPAGLSEAGSGSTARKEKAEGGEGGPTKPVASGATEGRPDGPARALPTQSTQLNGSQQSRPSAEGDQADRVRFVQRVARAFQAVGHREGSVRLRLSPPELGSLKLEISVRGGVMAARVEAETAAARNLLLDNLPALRERLAQHDIKVEHFDVDLTDGSTGGFSDRAPSHTQSEDGGQNNHAEQSGVAADREADGRSRGAPAARLDEGTQLDVVI